ncbi:Vacuolar protein sorting-associated protein vts1 [Ceratocystis platani]|uniref:Vacuolar protein sorting-associated protein vts1 n=1 Tax=Ceratocystis fimbriata f. sp. platani TaxID=88771 RepID=A0A0F8BLP4_CERFI|nr:Vacuolar protein sorting-associated protein vts1 [Ceratocystis platani]
MASEIPDGLRQPELLRFLLRANQVRQVKPAIAYWCEYYVLDQIISRQLHTTDEECLEWTTALMSRLEQTKTEHADETITDDTAGQAYVEQFAQQAFERGERVLRANKVTKQTADTFDAAATFFSLAKIWGAIDEETRQKIMFCKWNGARILKAIRAGEDPNASNPVLDEPESQYNDEALASSTAPEANANANADLDAGLEAGFALVPTAHDASPTAPRPVTVEDVADPEIELPSQPQLNPETPSFLPSVPQEVTSRNVDPPSPMSVTDETSGWPPAAVSASVSPTGPSVDPYTAPAYNSAPPSVPPAAPILRAPPATASPPIASPTSAPPADTWKPPAPTSHSFSTDEADAAKAQKHAKWAISALNFEDVPTAVKELRNALAALGAL